MVCMNKIVSIVISFFILSNCFGQQPNHTINDINKVIPPTPESAAIEKYGNIPVSYSTGVPSIGYPLWSWKRGNLEFSTSLSYHAGGHKVDDMATHVGLGWSLSGFPRISRTVKGFADDRPNLGYLYRSQLSELTTPYSSDLYFNIPYDVSEQQDIPHNIVKGHWNCPDWSLVNEIYKGQIDGEQDVFSFNINNQSGRFVIDRDKNILPLETTNIKIEALYEFNQLLNIHTIITGFIVTDDKGVIYNFDVHESQSSTSVSSDMTLSPNYNTGFISNWLLRSVIDPISGDSIVFEYISAGNNLQYETGFSESETIDLNKYEFTNNIISTEYRGIFSLPIVSNYLIITTSTLLPNKVYFPDGSELLFSHNHNRLDYNGAKATTNIQVINAQNNLIKNWDLLYSYFDCSISGFCTPNPYFTNDITKRLRLDGIDEKSSFNNEIKPTRFHYNNTPLNVTGSKNTDFWGYNVNPNRNNPLYFPKIPIDEIELNFIAAMSPVHQVKLDGSNKDADPEFVKAAILEKIVYPTGGYTEFEFECNSAFSSINYYEEIEITNELKWFKNAQPPNYQYNEFQQILFPQRIGEFVLFKFKADELGPRPQTLPSTLVNCFENQQDNTPIQFIIKSTDNSVNVNITENYGAIYNGLSRMVELPLGLTYEVKFIYTINTECDDMFPFEVTVNAEYTVEKHDKLVGGLRIKKITSFDGINNYVKTYSYLNEIGKSSAVLNSLPDYGYYRTSRNEHYFENINGNYIGVKYRIYSINRNSSPRNTLNYYNGSPLIYKVVTETELDGSSIIREFDPFVSEYTGGLFKTPHMPTLDFPNLSGLLLKEITKDSEGNLVQTRDIEYQKFIETLPIVKNRNLSIMIKATGLTPGFKEYYISNEYSYRVSKALEIGTITKYYKNNEIMESVETKIYNTQNYLSCVSVDNSKSESIRTFYYYPFSSSSTGSVYDLMEQMNMLNLVTSVKKYKFLNHTSTLLNEQNTNFSVFNSTKPLTSSIQSALLGNDPQTEITFNQYDDKGNILQYTAKDGIVHSFIWGYNKQYPVAHIVGVDYNTASALVNLTVLNAATTTDQDMRTELDKLHTGITNQLSQVTTYTYIPLVGIKTVKDVNNKLITYEYDNFYRLKLVRDQDGNILSAQEYQYAQ